MLRNQTASDHEKSSTKLMMSQTLIAW